MSATTSTATGAAAKAQGSQHARQGSQGPRVSNGSSGAQRKPQNGGYKGDFKGDGGRNSPHSSANGQQGKTATQSKPKATTGMSEYLRARGATVEVASSIAQIRSDLGGYYSEELVYNTFVANGNNAEATRAALTQTKATSWASKVGVAASSTPAVQEVVPVPAPAHIAAQQQGPRPRKVKQEKKPAEAPVAAELVPEPAVDPEQMQKSLESALQAHQTQTQELLNLHAKVSQVRTEQSELTSEKEGLLQKIAQQEAEIAKDRTRIKAIESALGEHQTTLADLHKTIAAKTTKA